MKSISYIAAAVLTLTGMGFTGCSSDDPMTNDGDVAGTIASSNESQSGNEDPSFKPTDLHGIHLTGAQQATLASQNAFSKKLMVEMLDDNSNNGNIFISPLSVHIFLGMLANGTDEAATQEILNALEVNDIESLNALYATLIPELAEADNQVTLSLANSLWLSSALDLNYDYITTLKNVFDADIFSRDLATPETKAAINNWVSGKTNNMLPNFLESNLDPFAVMVNINATYFKGKWKFAFDEKATKEGYFTNANGVKSKIHVMEAVADDNIYTYREDDKGRLLELPYGNGAYRMCVYLPSSEEPIRPRNCEEAFVLSDSRVSKDVKANLKFPKFDFEYDDYAFQNPLKKLGITRVFESTDSPFSPLNPTSPIYINQVINKSKISFSESGAEAASAIAGIMYGASDTMTTPSYEEIDFNVNRPFIYIIKEWSTNAIVFAGVVNNL